MLRIFLAHASEDKDRVIQLYERLEEGGYRPWLDKKDLIPGQNWRTVIPEIIRTSEVFIACISQNSVNKDGYIQNELRTALETYANKPQDSIYLIPLRLDDCPIPNLRGSDHGAKLSDLHRVNYFESDGFQQLLKALEHAKQSTNFSHDNYYRQAAALPVNVSDTAASRNNQKQSPLLGAQQNYTSNFKQDSGTAANQLPTVGDGIKLSHKLKHNDFLSRLNFRQRLSLHKTLFSSLKKFLRLRRRKRRNLSPRRDLSSNPDNKKIIKRNQPKVKRATIVVCTSIGLILSVSVVQILRHSAAVEERQQIDSQEFQELQGYKNQSLWDKCIEKAEATEIAIDYKDQVEQILSECQLQKAISLANEFRYKDAITTAREVSETSAIYDAIQENIETWENEILETSKNMYEVEGNLEDAIRVANALDKESPIYREAQNSVAEWESIEADNSKVFEQIEIAKGKNRWYEVVSLVSEIHSTPFWTNKVLDIEREAQTRISEANRSPVLKSTDGTNETLMYDQLESYLAARVWSKADQQTTELILSAGSTDGDQLLSTGELRNFSCNHLLRINTLWNDYSDGNFGLSTQKKLVEDILGDHRDLGPNNYYKVAKSFQWTSLDQKVFLENPNSSRNLIGNYTRWDGSIVNVPEGFFPAYILRQYTMLELVKRTHFCEQTSSN